MITTINYWSNPIPNNIIDAMVEHGSVMATEGKTDGSVNLDWVDNNKQSVDRSVATMVKATRTWTDATAAQEWHDYVMAFPTTPIEIVIE